MQDASTRRTGRDVIPVQGVRESCRDVVGHGKIVAFEWARHPPIVTPAELLIGARNIHPLQPTSRSDGYQLN